MNYLDIIIGILLLLGLFKGLKNGLLIEVASLIALVLGIYGAIHFSYYAVDFLTEKVDWSIQAINLAAFAVTFIIIVLVITLAGRILTKVASLAMLGIVNRILGAAFGLLKSAFILSVILMFLAAMTSSLNLIDEEIRESSILYSLIKPIAPAVLPSILEEVKEFRENEDTDKSKIELQSV
ncbi:MAG: colicin V production protein [Leeuwenhoekiella sp.]|uniref:CvpA family protein n=1 Tax=Leeuwenhoekiella palythoae TaxID=573501 RepID=UPI000C3D0AF5|nr:CvpA family protein [Leeuwenhoekiella palythoae]MAS19080.1 colicin V production protein [Leeuwenhoekiella sp.]UBZ11985.1 CvpA family protein [Leeuwenhoekiella palythoae]HAX14167.1 colicin V production protein [Leeuwenhoekiella sp.]|tara:strand:- start:324 stop:866 length:543 start_codon:yes stop_codon:yes gene_type:complete